MSITITVPLDYFALNRASDMLHGMALDLENQGKQQARRGDDRPVSDRPGRVDAEAAFRQTEQDELSAEELYAETMRRNWGESNAEQEEKDAAAVFGSQPGKPPVSGASDSSTPAETATEQATTTPSASGATAPGASPEQTSPSADSPNEPAAQPAPAAASPGTASAGTTAAPAGVDLAPATTDPDKLVPWDHRIHAGSKAKLAKKPHGWKMKRGVDDSVVAEVEAELIAAMAAGPANPVEPKRTPAPASAPAASETPAPAPAAAPASPTPTPPPAAATGAITSFPALMQKITAAGIPQATVTAAVNKQGLQALPLLAARPDLIPAVAAELFPGG